MGYCKSCEQFISEAEDSFSIKSFNKPLCKEHQPSEEAGKLGMALVEKGWGVEFKKEIDEKDDNTRHVDIAVEEAQININVDISHYPDREEALEDLKNSFNSSKKDFLTIKIPGILVDTNEKIKETAAFIDELLRERAEQLEDK